MESILPWFAVIVGGLGTAAGYAFSFLSGRVESVGPAATEERGERRRTATALIIALVAGVLTVAAMMGTDRARGWVGYWAMTLTVIVLSLASVAMDWRFLWLYLAAGGAFLLISYAVWRSGTSAAIAGLAVFATLAGSVGWAQQHAIEGMPEAYNLQSFDDCGVYGLQPHVVKTGSWNHTFPADQVQADSKARTVAAGDRQVLLRYEDLSSALDYVIAITYASEGARVQSLWAGDIELHVMRTRNLGDTIHRSRDPASLHIVDGERRH